MHETSHSTSLRAMAGLFTLSPDIQNTWDHPDFPEMLKHQWVAPLIELSGQLPESERIAVEQLFAQSQLQTYGQLLSCDHPPVMLLELVRQHFKNHIRDNHGMLPMELARLLYYITVVVGITRVGRWFSQLSDHELQKAIQWGLSRPWIDDFTRRIFSSGQVYLEQALRQG